MTKKEQVIARIAKVLSDRVDDACERCDIGDNVETSKEKSFLTTENIKTLLRQELHDIPEDWMEHEW